jgi:hypothetical protein
VTLERDGVVVLRFAATYGFRNIQNLVQKLKRGKSPYHFVEVMACPSGEERGGFVCWFTFAFNINTRYYIQMHVFFHPTFKWVELNYVLSIDLFTAMVKVSILHLHRSYHRHQLVLESTLCEFPWGMVPVCNRIFVVRVKVNL